MKYLNDINYKDCVGKILKSKNSGGFKIVEYNNSRSVEIQFIKQQIKKSKLVAEQEKIKRLNKITNTLKGV